MSIYLNNDSELEQFCAILGIFDSSGPAILSVPKYGVIYGENIDLKEFLNDPDELIGRDGFSIPLLYDQDENPGRKTLVVIRREQPEFEILRDKSTFAHEAHHMLNLCSSPVGLQSHLGQKLLNQEFVKFFVSLGNKKNEAFYNIGIPLIKNYKSKNVPNN